MRRAFHLLLSAGVALIASAGLASAKDTLTIGMVLEPPGLDPTSAPAAAIGSVTHYNIFEGLTKINEDFSVTPLLAEKWTFSPDLKTLTFTLKPNVKFQDGEPFSSKDVKFSFERFAAKDSTNKDKVFFASIESIETPDPMTVVLKFKEPSFEALFHLGMETAVILDEKSAATEATNPVGTGPYKLASWTKGASVTLDKWDGYRDPSKIPLVGATFRFIPDPSAEVAALLAGDVDDFPEFQNVQALDQFKSDPRFQVLIGGTEGKTILAMNNKKKPLDELKVRQAIAYAIDRKAVIDGAENGLGAPIGSHLTPNDPGYVDLTGMYPYDPAKSKELLKEAGVTTPLDLSLILPPPAYARQGGQIIAAELAQVGINAKIQEVAVGPVAVGRVQGPQLRPDHRQPRRAARHRHLRQSELLLPVRQPGLPGDLRQGDVRARSRGVQGGDGRGAKEDRRGLRQRLPVPAAERDGGEREAAGPVEEHADLRHRPDGDVVEMSAGQRSA